MMPDESAALSEALDIAIAERDRAFEEIDALKAEVVRLTAALTMIAEPVIIPLGSNLWDVISRLRRLAWEALQK